MGLPPAISLLRAGTIIGRPSWLPVPDFALLTLLGEGASVVLEGQKVAQTEGVNRSFIAGLALLGGIAAAEPK